MPVSRNVDDRTWQPVVDQANQNPKTHEKEPQIDRRNPLCSDIPEWLEELRENLVDDEVPERGDSLASSCHGVSLEPTFKRREDLCEHSVHTHFRKDRSCQICQRTKITRAPCRRRNGGAVPRVENFGDATTADHKVLNGISKQSSIRSLGPGLGHLLDPVVSEQNKNFSGNKGACKSQKSFTLPIPWN